MKPTTEHPEITATASAHTRDRDSASLARGIRRLTTAVWWMAVFLIAVHALPWLTFLLRVRRIPVPAQAFAAEEDAPRSRHFSDFDNQFHARPLEVKIQRATVILLTQSRAGEDKHKRVVTEILKRSPGVRFYYSLGDELVLASHPSGGSCDSCEADEAVVFMLGNPAHMVSSYSVRGGRIVSLGGLPMATLRTMVQQNQAALSP